MLRMPYTRSRPLLYAHRGAATEQPENTMPAFRRALDIGADALELDLHMTADGHIVVSHDASALRMTGVAVEYRHAILRDVKSWDAGYGFIDAEGGRPHAGKGITVPTFEEILSEFPGVPLNVDIKQLYPSMASAVVDLLRRTRNTERVTLASFRTRIMQAVGKLGYEGPTAMSRYEVVGLLVVPNFLWSRFWRVLGRVATAAQIPTHSGLIRMDTRRWVDSLHNLGLRVDYWTINDPDQARYLLAQGVDGIMTDDPAAIKPVFDDLGL